MSNGQAQAGIFDSDAGIKPLADRMRPQRLEDYVGQQHILAPNKPLRTAIEQGAVHSMILWGPPGTGKTTLAKLMAHYCQAEFMSLSAVLAGVKDVRAAVDQAKMLNQTQGRPYILFIDEVHRFNKAQQDAFLPHIEDGTIYFIGATTENPSFELNNALLSRVRTYLLKSIESNDIVSVLKLALQDEAHGLGRLSIEIDEALLLLIAEYADGDVRRALNLLEIASDLAEPKDGRMQVSKDTIQEITQQSMRRFDKGGDIFYEQISALHKSVRGSNPDAALYWYCRMLDGGCDPLYIARRVLRMAAEDIGNADPRALALALDAWQAYERLGSPEGELIIAQAIVYLACAAKSNAAYRAYKAAMQDAKASGSLEVPMHLRNAPTQLMKTLGYGKDYRYAHDETDGFAAGEQYFPDSMGEQEYYFPVERGLEIKIAEKIKQLRTLNKAASRKK